MRNLLTSFNFILFCPHIACFYLHKNRGIISADIKRWLNILEFQKSSLVFGLIYLLTFHREFRNLFYYRVGTIRHLLKIICPELANLYLMSPKIGEGLYIQHGFSTIISAKSVGKNCWINQQVTVGFSNKYDSPVIKDNVTIYAGAKIIGDVTVGENSIIGANAVVVKDVPANATVVGIPAHVIKINGKRVHSDEFSTESIHNIPE